MAALELEEGADHRRRRLRPLHHHDHCGGGVRLLQDPHPRCAVGRHAAGVQGLLQRRQDRGGPVRHDQPGDPHLQPVPRGAPRRGGGGRGQELLARGRHLAHRYPPRRLLRPHQFRREPAGRFHHHPAAGQELLRRHRHGADREPQDQGDLRRAEARPGQVQGVDPPAVPEHGLLRRWRLRCRRGGTGLLRPGPQPPQQDHPGAGRDDRRDDPEPELLQARPQRRSGPRGPGVPLEVRAPDHGHHGHAVPAGLLGGAAEVPGHRRRR